MKKIFILLFIPISLFGQKELVNEIILDYCQSSQKNNWKIVSNATYFRETLITPYQEIQKKYSNSLNLLKQKIRDSNSGLSDNEILQKIEKLFFISLTENCPSFITATRKLLPSPKENESLRFITEKVQNFLTERSFSEHSNLINAVDSLTFFVITENDRLIAKDYKNVFADQNLREDLQVFLFHNINEYYQAYLVFSAEQKTK